MSGKTNEEDVSPVRMVRRANPYETFHHSMTCTCRQSAHQRPTERFGLDVFRNSVNDPDAIRMDLPVGPDHVLGPGECLEIDRWGAVSQRVFRVVDREKGAFRCLKLDLFS
jgi:hypothetical protein